MLTTLSADCPDRRADSEGTCLLPQVAALSATSACSHRLQQWTQMGLGTPLRQPICWRWQGTRAALGPMQTGLPAGRSCIPRRASRSVSWMGSCWAPHTPNTGNGCVQRYASLLLVLHSPCLSDDQTSALHNGLSTVVAAQLSLSDPSHLCSGNYESRHQDHGRLDVA